ncbi:hypothetical protein ACHAXT_010599 [Thalassiosira profunda]
MKRVPPAACLAVILAGTACSFSNNALRIQRPQSLQRTSPITCTDARTARPSTSLAAYGRYGNGRSSPRSYKGDRTKRQERVGHVVRTELASLLHRSTLKNDDDPIEPELRRRINVVHADVSPDLRQARITVSIMSLGGERGSDSIAKRRAYAWLVRNTRSIRHALAQKMAHMKGGSPDLTFAQVDVGAAVDVMHLIEKVSEGYKRDDVLEMEEEWDEDDDDDEGWDDFDFDEDGEGISVEVEV